MTVDEIKAILEKRNLDEPLCVEYHTEKTRYLTAAAKKLGYAAVKFTTVLAKTKVDYTPVSKSPNAPPRHEARRHII